MKIKSRHTHKEQDVSFINWYYDTPNKEDFIVTEWDDLVYWQLIDSKGVKNDHKIIARDHAQRIHDKDPKKNSMRELTQSEWEELRRHFFDSSVPNFALEEKATVQLKNIEKEFLRYVAKSIDNVKSTKTFADAHGFSVSTINDVAKSLNEKYLITMTSEAGLDPITQRSYTSFRCEPTPLGANLIENGIVSLKKPLSRFKLELSHKIALGALLVAIIVLLFGNNIVGRIRAGYSVDHKVKTDTSVVDQSRQETTIDSLKLPYLENVPILDKGLFIKHYYNDLVLGGVNIDTISIGVRSKAGESMKLYRINMEISLSINQEPYIEFEYKGIVYSLEIIGQHYAFHCTLKSIENPTLRMKSYVEL